jgi:REP element-mobilizing transposase RayT
MGRRGGPFPRPIRLRREAYAEGDATFHITIRALPDTVPFVGLVGRPVWACVLDTFERDTARVFAACLMPDHIHLVVQPGSENVLD